MSRNNKSICILDKVTQDQDDQEITLLSQHNLAWEKKSLEISLLKKTCMFSMTNYGKGFSESYLKEKPKMMMHEKKSCKKGSYPDLNKILQL